EESIHLERLRFVERRPELRRRQLARLARVLERVAEAEQDEPAPDVGEEDLVELVTRRADAGDLDAEGVAAAAGVADLPAGDARPARPPGGRPAPCRRGGSGPPGRRPPYAGGGQPRPSPRSATPASPWPARPGSAAAAASSRRRRYRVTNYCHTPARTPDCPP